MVRRLFGDVLRHGQSCYSCRVIMADSPSPFSDDELELQRQLGRPPCTLGVVETRCASGHPQVIRNYPLQGTGNSRAPFPTLFWLVCPKIHDCIARLERSGGVRAAERFLRENDDQQRKFLLDHQRYISERWETLQPEDRSFVEERGWKPVFFERGIGGIADRRRVKCLHLHYAHHLARGNTVGGWIDGVSGGEVFCAGPRSF